MSIAYCTTINHIILTQAQYYDDALIIVSSYLEYMIAMNKSASIRLVCRPESVPKPERDPLE